MHIFAISFLSLGAVARWGWRPGKEYNPGKACLEGGLWAAWLLGDEDLVSYQLDQLVLSAMQEMDDDGELTDGFFIHDGFDQGIHAWSTASVSYQILHTLGGEGMVGGFSVRPGSVEIKYENIRKFALLRCVGLVLPCCRFAFNR